MPTSEPKLPYELPGLKIICYQHQNQQVVFHAQSLKNEGTCPDCKHHSRAVHSYYNRSCRDLPMSGIPVTWKITARRFRCKNRNCLRKTFTERFSDVVQSNGQRTNRFTQHIQHIAFCCSAEAGARVAKKLGIPTSGDTLLRVVRSTSVVTSNSSSIIGIDDWSFKRGLRYGSIIIDLETRKPIELLPDRTSSTVEKWLKCHPNIRIVTRDRSREFRNGIDLGAPQAQQIADRWHILKNYQEAIGKQLQNQTNLLKQAAKPMVDMPSNPSIAKDHPPNHEHRQDLFAEVKRLHEEGVSTRKIATITGASRSTIKRYLLRETLPDWKNRSPKATNLTPYHTLLKFHWENGCKNARVLFEVIQRQGYNGSYASVRRYVCLYFRNNPLRTYQPIVYRFHSPKQVAFLMIKRRSKLTEIEQLFLSNLVSLNPKMDDLYQLSQKFVTMFRSRDVTQFHSWLIAASTSQFSFLYGFVKGLKADYRAVRAALVFEWNNGQTEGQVNRLKFIKRQMYGRANFDLLRLKVLYQS